MSAPWHGPVPTWLSELDDTDLRRRVGLDTYRRGIACAAADAVLRVTTGDAGRMLLGAVVGSGGGTYQTLLTARTDGTGALLDWSSRCSCPIAYDCKHVVAVVLAVRGQGPAAPAAPAWERQLADLVRPEPEPPVPVPLALQVEVTTPPRGTYGATTRAGGPRVRLAPVRPGRSGRWVKSGASWQDLDLGYVTTRPEQRDALLALAVAGRTQHSAYAPYGEIVVHLDELGRRGWALLRALAEVDVPLVGRRPGSTQPLAVELTKPADVVLDLRRSGGRGAAGAVELRAGVHVPGGPDVDLGHAVAVGEPATGLVLDLPDRLLLVPFERVLDAPTSALLGQRHAVRIPADDVARFLTHYYPALRQRVTVVSADASVALPVVELPRLGLDVRFEPGHRAVLRWGYLYALSGDHVRVPPVPGHGEVVVRDRGAEQALLHALADVAGVPGLSVGPVPSLAETVTILGVETAAFVERVLPVLLDRDDVVVEVRGSPVSYGESEDEPRIALSATQDVQAGRSDWFDLDVEVSIGHEQVPLAALIAALTNGEEHLILDSGTWFRVNRPELQALRLLVEEARELQDRGGDDLRVTPWQAGLWEELVSLGVVARQSERWERTVGALLDLDQLPHPAPPAMLRAQLRPYQLEGYHWLAMLWDHGLGGILADDMGLGKTVQTLAMAARAYEQGTLTAPLLIVAPTSVVSTWAGEAERFCPDLRVVTVTGTERRVGLLAERVEGAHLVVTSYALLRIDEEAYRGVTWSGLVLDEAQFVKNHRAKTYQCARRLEAPFKLAITGTPLENSLMDLWSLLSITAPGLWPSPQRFTAQYRKPIESGQAPEQLATLRRRVRPLMLRRTKEQVAQDLPPKVEQTLVVTLNPAQRRVYDRQLQRERQRVLGLIEDLQHNRIAVFRSLMLLRQLSLDASLVDPAHAGVIASSKIDVLMEHLAEVVAEGHRALVFSQFTGFLGIVRSRLDTEGIAHCYLDGRTRDRPRRIAEFRDGDAPVFLISLKAGGFGLTLTEADYVFVLDPWWNPAAENQAIDRTHRIGQERTVMVYRLVATDTVEEKVVALQERKRDLFARVVDDPSSLGTALTADDIRGLFDA